MYGCLALCIVGVVALVLIAEIVLPSWTATVEDRFDAEVQADFEELRTQIEEYRRVKGAPPGALSDLPWEERLDPWGRAYGYAREDGGGYRLWTLGADGEAGGRGAAADRELR